MNLINDRFVQTMLYSSLFYGSNIKDVPAKGFKIYEDGTMSYVTRDGVIREVEVAEDGPGHLNVKVIDVLSNEIYSCFSMAYEKQECQNCNSRTIHGLNNGRLYCTECGVYE